MVHRSIFVSAHPLPLDAVGVGWLIEEPHAPQQGFFNPCQRIASNPTISMSAVNNVSKLIKGGNGSGLEVAIASFASTFLRGENKDIQKLTVKAGKRHSLLNSAEWFEEIRQAKETQVWLERAAMRGRKIALTDVDVDVTQGWKVGAGAGVQAPILAAAGIPIPPPLDPEAKGDISIEREYQMKMEIPDEKIHCAQYRQIKLKRATDKTNVSAKVRNKVWWEQVYSERGAAEDEMDDDDVEAVIEADLKEGFDEGLNKYAHLENRDDAETYFYDTKSGTTM
jgi:hypothetical protein